MKKDLDKRGCRRMLVTTLGRIERLEYAMRNMFRPEDGFWTADECAKKIAECEADLIKEHAKLKYYNDMAARLMKV